MIKTRLYVEIAGPPEGEEIELYKRLLMPYKLAPGDRISLVMAEGDGLYDMVVADESYFELVAEEWCVTLNLSSANPATEEAAQALVADFQANGWISLG